MKKVSLLIGALLFSTLFYKQSLGLNMVIFSIISNLVLILYNLESFKKTKTIVFSIIYIVTAFFVFFQVSTLSIIANCIAFITLIGHVSGHKSSIYVNWFNGLYTLSAGYFHRQFGATDNRQNNVDKKDIDYVHWIKIIGIPAIIVVIFISLYRNGNPVFNDLISKIDFSFINIPWLLFSVLGYYLLYNISQPIFIDSITQSDLNIGNILKRSDDLFIEETKKENQLGIILFTLLNSLIVIFLITDFAYLLSKIDLRASVLSNQLHSGVYALIISIVIAILIILYFFRGQLNFYKNNRTLKILTFTWIALNIILIINTTIKDSQYIYYFGFTYKRIGVLIYLLLTTIGLITTAIKVKQIKNFWYLLRTNAIYAFTILMVSSTINWDKHITHFNIKYAKSADFKYLINLSNNNTFILKYYSDTYNLKGEMKTLVDDKYSDYVEALNNRNWQELSYDNLKLK